MVHNARLVSYSLIGSTYLQAIIYTYLPNPLRDDHTNLTSIQIYHRLRSGPSEILSRLWLRCVGHHCGFTRELVRSSQDLLSEPRRYCQRQLCAPISPSSLHRTCRTSSSWTLNSPIDLQQHCHLNGNGPRVDELLQVQTDITSN